MDIITEVNNITVKDGSALTFGNFDGVHLGHQALIKDMVQRTREQNLESILVTFNPHPQTVLDENCKRRFLLQSFRDRLEKIKKLGVDKVVCIKFDKNFSKIEPIEFIKILVKNYFPKYIFSNKNNYFGYKKRGDLDLLLKYSKKMNYNVIDVEYIKKSNKIISSSLIRGMVEKGDLLTVKKLLGRNLEIEGKVVRGSGIGSKIGFPTANLEISEMVMLPNDGVYYVKVVEGKEVFSGMCNIGFRPTIGSQKNRCIEVHLINKEGIDLYGKKIKIIIIKFIRNETKFNSMEELKGQLIIDKELCLKY